MVLGPPPLEKARALRPGLIKPHPEICAYKADGAGLSCGFSISSGVFSNVFDLVEEPFHEATPPMDHGIRRAMNLSVALDGGCAHVRHARQSGPEPRRRHVRDQPPPRRARDRPPADPRRPPYAQPAPAVTSLPQASRDDRPWHCSDARAATRTTDGVILAPFSPEAACWWARMIGLSMKCMLTGGFSERVSTTRTQTPIS